MLWYGPLLKAWSIKPRASVLPHKKPGRITPAGLFISELNVRGESLSADEHGLHDVEEHICVFHHAMKQAGATAGGRQGDV